MSLFFIKYWLSGGLTEDFETSNSIQIIFTDYYLLKYWKIQTDSFEVELFASAVVKMPDLDINLQRIHTFIITGLNDWFHWRVYKTHKYIYSILWFVKLVLANSLLGNFDLISPSILATYQYINYVKNTKNILA